MTQLKKVEAALAAAQAILDELNDEFPCDISDMYPELYEAYDKAWLAAYPESK